VGGRGGHNLGLRPTPYKASLAQTSDTTSCCGHTESSTRFAELGLQPKKDFVVSFPTHQKTPRFDVVCGRCGQFRPGWSADSEPDAKTKLEMSCNHGFK